jgi:hypothetical protein
MKPRPFEYKDFASYCTVTCADVTPYQGHIFCGWIFTTPIACKRKANVPITPQFPEQSPCLEQAAFHNKPYSSLKGWWTSSSCLSISSSLLSTFLSYHSIFPYFFCLFLTFCRLFPISFLFYSSSILFSFPPFPPPHWLIGQSVSDTGRPGQKWWKTDCTTSLLLLLPLWLGYAVAQWLKHCATNRKVAGSIPDGVIGIFHWHNPSGRTIALGTTQPLTEMSTRNISWG